MRHRLFCFIAAGDIEFGEPLLKNILQAATQMMEEILRVHVLEVLFL